MTRMKNHYIKVFLLMVAVSAACACHQKKRPSLSGPDPVDISDFIAFFPDASLPFTVSDTLLEKKMPDSLVISHAVFSAFVPDSVLGREFGKGKLRIYPLGKTTEKGKETYLFIKAVQGQKRAGYVLCFDKSNDFRSALQLVKTSADPAYSAYGSIDKKFQLTTYRETKSRSGSVDFKHNVYIYNDAAREFTLIVTEPGKELAEEVLNPIDTFPQKNRLSGDYTADKHNFVSFRDSRKPTEILFFTHFEKDKGECRGELKGTARMVSPKIAQYKENGNPCTLEFTFGTSSVTMKEVEGCGSYRDIKCFFEGTYQKKKRKDTKTKNGKGSPDKKPHTGSQVSNKRSHT